MNKIKKTSFLVISVLIIASIGGVMAKMDYGFSGTGHTGCHGSTKESETGTIVDPNLPAVPGGIDISPSTTLNPGQRFNATILIVDFTEANNVSEGRKLPGQSGNVTVQIAPLRGDNDEFGFNWYDLGATPENEEWYREQQVLDASGNSTELKFWLIAPDSAGTYTLVIDALSGYNYTKTGNAGAIQLILATASVSITVRAAIIISSSDGDGGDRDLWKEETIPGYILIITIASIFSVSAILILRIKKLKRRTT